MNKTFTANIGGMVFHIEEHAYEGLKKYLDSVSQRMKSTSETKEVLQDIELRIAELFQERLGRNRQVITQEDIQAIIVTLGLPEEFDSVTSTDTAGNAPAQPAKKFRRIYRDPDDEILAGVCSGLAYRLGIDPLWVRLIFLGAFFFLGSSLLLYIILAILLPRAETAAQKLEMKGLEVTIANLQQAASAAQPEKKTNFISRILILIRQLIKLSFKVVLLLVFIVLAFVSVSILLALIFTILTVLGVTGIGIPIILSGFVLSPLQVAGMLAAMILLFGVPAFVILYFIIRKVLRIRKQSKWLPVIAIILMILGLLIFLATAIDVAADFSVSNQFRQAISFQLSSNGPLYIAIKENEVMEEEDSGTSLTPFDWKNALISVHYDKEFISGQVELTVQKAHGPHFEIIQINHARGQNKKQAFENAQSILYAIEQRDSVLYLDRYFKLDRNTRFRDQRIRLILKVPEEKSIHFMEGCDEILSHIPNLNQMNAPEMINHTWTMTAGGLECRTCDGSNYPYQNDQ